MEVAVETWVDREHRLRHRAEQISRLLNALWGDLPPLGLDPQLTTLIDAVAGDDDHGRNAHLVVHGDGLTYHQLADALLTEGSRLHALSRLPSDLRDRLVSAGCIPSTNDTHRGAVSAGMTALPDDQCGAWDLNAATNVITFDATCARLLDLGHRPGHDLLPTHMSNQVHPDDQPVIAAALEEALSTGRRYEVRFRSRMHDGSYAWRASRARALPATETTHAHLIGFIAADD